MSTVHLFIWTTQYTTECKITIIVSKPIHTSIRIVGDIIVISSEAATTHVGLLFGQAYVNYS
jgi:hypothetical protein